MNHLDQIDPLRYFTDTLHVTGVAHLGANAAGDPALLGKKVGVLNGSSWITPWANYFGGKFLPGAHLINVGNEAIQLNFMRAHEAGETVPPATNIAAFVRYARDLVELAAVDAILITCSTMNRAYPTVQQAMAAYDVPVVQIDAPMMAAAVAHATRRGGRVLVCATHGPTVESTQSLLRETAQQHGGTIPFAGRTVHEAWECLAAGDVEGHNRVLADTIRAALVEEQDISCVVLAQLSMTVFLLSHPNPEGEFGVPVFTSGQCGFEYLRTLLVTGGGMDDRAGTTRM